MKKKKIAGCFVWLLSIAMPVGSQGQTVSYPAQFQQLLKQEGEVFVAVEYTSEESQKKCRLEDLFTNTAFFGGDSLVIDFDNFTESFCESQKLETHLLYAVRHRDIDAGRVQLAQRNYQLGKNTLLEGQSQWYELHLYTRDNRPLITEYSVLENKKQVVSHFRILFKTMKGAQKAQSLLRQWLAVPR